MALILTPAASYEALFKACHKKQIRHVVLVRIGKPIRRCPAASAGRHVKRRRFGLHITACTPAAIQVPANGLDGGIYPARLGAGNVAVISWHAATSAGVFSVLSRAKLGLSRHISLQPGPRPNLLSRAARCPLMATRSPAWLCSNTIPTSLCADLLQRHPPPDTPKIGDFALHHHADEEEQAILRHLQRYCGFLVTFTPDEMLAAIHALACGKLDAKKLHVIARHALRLAADHEQPLSASPCKWPSRDPHAV